MTVVDYQLYHSGQVLSIPADKKVAVSEFIRNMHKKIFVLCSAPPPETGELRVNPS